MKSAALTLALLAPLPADDDVPSLARTTNGAPHCGLGKAFHAGRRERLAEELADGVLIVRGLHEVRDYRAFHQDKTFWYLTGVASQGASLLMDVESGREILFLPEATRRLRATEGWNGEIWDTGDEWVSELTGIAEVRAADELPATLEELAGADRVVWTSLHPEIGLTGGFDQAVMGDAAIERDPLDGRLPREKALWENLVERFGEERVKDCSPVLDAMRLVKTEEELAAMRRAARSGALAMSEAMRSTRPGLGEWELEGLMTFMHMKEGAEGPAYHAIVGAGPNSLVLHYTASARRMEDGEVVLIDYGGEVDHYTTDITRTWPVGGKFSERQAELYDIVLEAQEAAIAAVKPGMTIRELTGIARGVLQEHGVGNLMPHGLSHWIGMEVHDVGDYRTPLEPGMVFTIEPGVYEPDTDIGIRIEDVVVVTEDGCEVITALVPKEREEVERLVAEQGVLDWMAGE